MGALITRVGRIVAVWILLLFFGFIALAEPFPPAEKMNTSEKFLGVLIFLLTLLISLVCNWYLDWLRSDTDNDSIESYNHQIDEENRVIDLDNRR